MAGMKWTDKEDSVLQKYYSCRTPNRCAEILKVNGFNRSVKAVKKRAFRLGLKNENNDEGMTLTEISEITGVKKATIKHNASHGFFKTTKNAKGTYVVPFDVFDEIVELYKIQQSDEYIKCSEASRKLGFGRFYLQNAIIKGNIIGFKSFGTTYITKKTFKQIEDYLIKTGNARMNWVDFNERICCD